MDERTMFALLRPGVVGLAAAIAAGVAAGPGFAAHRPNPINDLGRAHVRFVRPNPINDTAFRPCPINDLRTTY